MKKIALLIVLLLLCAKATFAQKILFQDNFDSYLNYKFVGWTTNPSWKPGIMYLVVGSADTACLCNENPDVIANQRIAGLSDCAKSPFNFQPKPNELLSSPKINLIGISDVWLKYDSYFKKGNYNGIYEEATTEVSTNGGANWTVIQNVPRNQSMSAMQTYYLNLTPYTGYNDVRIGFRYNDNNQQIGGWAIDNVMVFQPSQKDLKLLTVSPEDTVKSYTAFNTGYIHEYTVQNMGLDTVKDFVVKYQQTNGRIYEDSVKGVLIAPFETYTYAHHIPDTITGIGGITVNNVIAWVELAGDTIHSNDTIRTSIRGAYFMPKKMVLVEEGTGTWHYLSPRGLVYMQQLESASYNACQVAVHDTDPMCIKEYNDYLYDLRQIFIPYFLIDRHIVATADSLLPIVKKEQANFGFAELNLGSYTDGNKFTLDANIKPAIDMVGDYRVILLLTENKVKGNGPGWEQVNGYADNQKGPMGGYETKPNPVPASDMQYNYVARLISPAPDGKTNLPHTLSHNQNYNVSFAATIDPSWNKNNMYASVFLFRYDDSTILNSNRIPFSLKVNKQTQETTIDAFLYPNPSTEQSILQFYVVENTKFTISVSDISGRTLFTFVEKEYIAGKNELIIPVNNLTTGLYLVTLHSTTIQKALKLQVVH